MPSSNQVIITNNTISSCTPVNLELTCGLGATGCSVQYYLNLSDDATVLKRNGVTLIENATLCIDLPAYVGCNKIPFYDSATMGLDARYFLEQIPEGADGCLINIGLDGQPGPEISFGDVVGEVKANEYSYSISWDFTTLPAGGLDLSAFDGCNMALVFKGPAAPTDGEGRALTDTNGFPLCDGLDEQCSSLCGRLTLCGTSAN